MEIRLGEDAAAAAVPANFIGFSFEVSAARVMLSERGQKDAPSALPRRSLLQLLENLAAAAGQRDGQPPAASAPPTIIRIGGNSADQSCYEYHAHDPASAANGGICKTNVTAADLETYEKFAEAADAAMGVGVTFVLGTNMAVMDPKWGAAEVREAVDMGLFESGVVRGVEIGNECDSYIATHPMDGLSFFDQYEKAFGKYVDAYHRSGHLPKGAVQGAAFADLMRPAYGDGLKSYLDRFGDELFSLSLHNYPTTTCAIRPHGARRVHMDEILERKASQGQAEKYRNVAALAAAHDLPLYIGEANSASCGGQKGVSDAFGSALWVLDYLAEMSKAGAEAVLFHGGPTGPYAAIAYPRWDRLHLRRQAPEVRPMYYGLLMFAELVAGGARWLSLEASLSGFGRPQENSAIHAVRDAGGNVRVLIISKEWGEAAEPFTAYIDLDLDLDLESEGARAPHVARATRLSAGPKGVFARTGIAYAGQSFDESRDGQASGSRVEEAVGVQRQAAGGAASTTVRIGPLQVQPASAILVHLTRAEQG